MTCLSHEAIMRAQLCCLLFLLVDSQERITGDASSISPYIKHFEGLSYDREDLHKKHLRARRDAQSQQHMLDLDFTAFHRTFRLRLRRNAGSFSSDFKVVSERGATGADLSHLYSGTLEGEHDSACHGSVLRGQFEGSIHADNVIYHVEAAHRYNISDHHSIIYREDDMVLPTRGNGLDSGFCGAGYLKTLAQSLKPVDQEAAANRARRTLDEAKTCCLIHLTADHRYFNKFGSVEAVVAQVASYMRAVNDIYDKVAFDGLKLINFKVKSLTVMTKENISDPLTPLYIGPEKLLSLYSENNWGNFCLSYLLTNRDYSGVLGLAWEGKAGNWGGICSQYTTLSNGRHSTLNTGLVTIQNYGQFLPPRHVQLTLAHELGHSLGAPHDEGSNCGSLGSSGGNGRYLMFPEATDKVRENNDKLSTCSVEHINELLRLKKDDCFVVSDTPICGNQIVEEGEECDVGHNYTDLCCYSTKERVGVQCRLKPGKVCSPSQGLCCSQECSFKSELQTCDEETDCQKESNCSGHSALCPDPSPKENLTLCSQGTRVCFNGVCAESVCVKHNLEQCDCPGEPDTCASTTSSVLSRHFQKKVLPLVGGAPCMGNQGYCDKFHVCRLLDADGPIARLKNSFLNLDEYEDLGEWMKIFGCEVAILDLLDSVTNLECSSGFKSTSMSRFTVDGETIFSYGNPPILSP
ncbi:disintegrin and metalloproteinase domain-containing protein 10 isoform X2 [Syngnathus scovelli]|uniref:disintegrin and metalloproteinase domain-containing protein 10 isoform X2 n=1 Tax=Syngnathus scovelli TaxID=161590 RepID=UPI0021103E04|nr:disintegrin and metalloproteinase domain-containing protein 10 isoform X2 [Syngnathus scovelli]